MATIPAERRRGLPSVSVPRSFGLRVAVGLLLLTGLSLYLRTRAFHAAFWIDEGLSFGISSHHLFDIPHVLRQDGSPPLYYMLLHVWMRVFGTSEPATHTLSLIFGLATIPVGFWAGRSLFGERAGWLAAVLFAFDTYLTTYSEETRMYSLMTLLALIATASFLHAFVFRRRRHLPVFAVALALMLYTHNWAFFFIAATLTALAVILWQRREERRELVKDAALAYGSAALLFAPWLPTLLFQIRHTGAPWAEVPSFGFLRHAPAMTLDGDRVALPLLLGAGAGLATVIRGASGRRRSAAIGGLAIFLGTLLWAWLWSQISPAWAYRYFGVFAAPMLLMAGVGLAYARRLGLVALAVVLSVWLPFNAISHKSIVRHTVRLASPHLTRGDLVISTHPEQVPLINYYMAPGMRYATELGPVRDPGVMDWVDALDRMRAATPRKNLEPLLATLRPGQHVLLMRPVIGTGDAWTAPWTKLVRQRSGDWARAMLHDRRFKLSGRYPSFKPDQKPRGMRALLFTRVEPG
jgi:mannosyltransferase